MSSPSRESGAQWHRLSSLTTDGLSGQIGDDTDSGFPARSAQERSAKSATTHDPFLDPKVPSVTSSARSSKYDSSHHLYNLWMWEILSILFSILCMAGIIATLLVYHRRPAPTLPLGLTLNALMSLLVTISKSAMLVSVASCISQLKWQGFRRPQKLTHFDVLDEVSRGPWGAFRFFWKAQILSLLVSVH